MGQIEVIQTRLAQNELELQREVDSLQQELKRDQDPGRMQLIQEMISVSALALVLSFNHLMHR